MEDFLLFLMLGLVGSAGPAHFGFRLLAHRHHRDRGWPFAAGTEEGGFSYSAWLMRRGYRAFADRDMAFFGFWGMLSGWIASLALVAATVMIALRA
ncbi:hypothetical protein [Silanimonas lenta]|uniref:hypothetical protein n=1 Tax=Silanimonas lenta TaxID=265429 RepID=UPI002FE38BC4